MGNDEQLEAVWKALEIIANASDAVLSEALAGFEGDDPEAFQKLEDHFSNEARWRG